MGNSAPLDPACRPPLAAGGNPSHAATHPPPTSPSPEVAPHKAVWAPKEGGG